MAGEPLCTLTRAEKHYGSARVLGPISLTLRSGEILGVRGANGAGMAACWLNPRHEARLPDVTVDYEIRALAELREFL